MVRFAAALDKQNPATTLLSPRRTAHPFSAPPHFTSSPVLALGKPVQWCPRTIARLATPVLTAAATEPPTSPSPTRQSNVPQHLAPDRLGRVSCCVLSHGERFDTTTADRPLTPTVQICRDNCSSMSLIPRSATANTPSGGFGFSHQAGRRRMRRRTPGHRWAEYRREARVGRHLRPRTRRRWTFPVTLPHRRFRRIAGRTVPMVLAVRCKPIKTGRTQTATA